MAYIAFVFVCCAWGSTFILMERVSHALGPVEIGISRLLTAATALGLIWWFKRDVYRLDRKHVPAILFSALVANAVPYVTQPYVLAQGYGHSFFGVAVAAVPILTIFMSVVLLDVWPTWRQLIGVGGGLLCLYFVIDDGFHRGMGWGIIALAAVVPLTASFNNTFIKLKLSTAQSLPMTAVMLGATGLMLLPLQFCPPALAALDLNGPVNPQFTASTLGYLLILGVVMTGLSTVAFFYLVVEKGPLFAGMATYVVPLLAMGWGWLDHEQITTQQVVAMIGVFAMVGLVQLGVRNRDELLELLPEATTDNLVPRPLGLRPAAAQNTPVALAATYSNAPTCSPPATSA